MPENIVPAFQVLKTTRGAITSDLIVCPTCGGEFSRYGEPRQVADDSFLKVRGEQLRIAFEGECGHRWEFCIALHNGQCFAFVEIIPQ